MMGLAKLTSRAEGLHTVASSTRATHSIPAIADTVFIYIADGQYAGSALFGQSLETLGSVGKWRGPVVVVSDHPACVEREQSPRAKKAGLQLHVVATPMRDNVTAMKLEKTRVWEHVAAAGFFFVRRVVYLDEDVLVGKPVQHFLDFVEQPAFAARAVLLFRDWYFPAELQTGVVVTRRGPAAEACLAQWAASMRPSGEAPPPAPMGHVDQQALLRTECVRAGTIGVLPPDDSLYWYPNGDGLNSGKRAVFMHFSNTGLMRFGFGSGSNWRSAILRFFKEERGVDDPWAQAICPIEVPSLLWLIKRR